MQCLASSSAAAGSISCNNNKTSSPRQAPRLLFALANMVLLLYVFHSAPPEHFDWFTAWMAMIVAHLIRFDALVCKKNGCCTEGGDLLSIIVGVATICGCYFYKNSLALDGIKIDALLYSLMTLDALIIALSLTSFIKIPSCQKATQVPYQSLDPRDESSCPPDSAAYTTITLNADLTPYSIIQDKTFTPMRNMSVQSKKIPHLSRLKKHYLIPIKQR